MKMISHYASVNFFSDSHGIYAFNIVFNIMIMAFMGKGKPPYFMQRTIINNISNGENNSKRTRWQCIVYYMHLIFFMIIVLMHNRSNDNFKTT